MSISRESAPYEALDRISGYYFQAIRELGKQAMGLKDEANKLYETLETLGPYEAPEGYYLLLESTSQEIPLIIEVQDERYNMPEFVSARPNTPRYNRPQWQLSGGRRGFIGRYIETDAGTGRVWVYNTYRDSRA